VTVPASDGRKPSFPLRAAKGVAAFFIVNWKTFAVAFAAGVFLALVGALGSGGEPLGIRLVYWVPMLLAGAVIGQLAGPWTTRRPRIGENALLVWAIVTVLVTIPVTALAWAYTAFIFGGSDTRAFFYFLTSVTLVTGVVTAIMMLINRPGPATHAPPTGQPASAPIRFLDRVPGNLKGGAIYAVQAEDHYLRIRTSKGSDLILMRLADAIAELEGIEGAQTHRSWWVAKDGIASAKRTEGRLSLVLKDGAEAPVSRPNAKALRESGWL
jgi:DNA-binding LytR/AlgR family response regulator